MSEDEKWAELMRTQPNGGFHPQPQNQPAFSFQPQTAAAGSSWFPKAAIADPIVAQLVADVAALRAELEEAKREIVTLKAHDTQNMQTFYAVQDMLAPAKLSFPAGRGKAAGPPFPPPAGAL